MRYAVVIEKADGNYSAYVPDLPGCVATGATVFLRSIAMVNGPTPPGTGVNAPATSATFEIIDPNTPKTRPLVAKGPIELQTHGSEIRFRSIYIREIPAAEAGQVR